jgi:hypothetical protein
MAHMLCDGEISLLGEGEGWDKAVEQDFAGRENVSHPE